MSLKSNLCEKLVLELLRLLVKIKEVIKAEFDSGGLE
jgi:hypothetical protein